MNILEGKRTYILAGAGLLTIGAYLLGVIDTSTANALLAVFGFGGLITLRAAL